MGTCSIYGLMSDDPAERTRALDQMIRLELPSLDKHLVALINDSDPVIAARVIGEIETRQNRQLTSMPQFSLVELIIVVAIIAGLTGACVPLLQTGCGEAPIAKVKQDLDTIRAAIWLHERSYGPWISDDLDHLQGKTMQEVPNDPWGNQYHVDPEYRLLWSLGADDQPGGTDENVDVVLHLRRGAVGRMRGG